VRTELLELIPEPWCCVKSFEEGKERLIVMDREGVALESLGEVDVDEDGRVPSWDIMSNEESVSYSESVAAAS